MQIASKEFLILVVYIFIMLFYFAFKHLDLYSNQVQYISNSTQDTQFDENFNQTTSFIKPTSGSPQKNNTTLQLRNLDIRLAENSNDRLNEYLNFLKGITTNSSLNNKNKKVIFCDPRYGGYGNRVYNFLSCFVFGLLSHSFVILKSWKESRDYIDLPFNPFDVPNIPDIDFLNPDYEKNEIVELKTPFAWNNTKDLNTIMNFQIPENATRFYFGIFDALFMVLCSNPKYYDALIYYELVRNETVQKSVSTMNNASSSSDEKTQNLFMIGFEVGANLLNKIIIPKPNIQEKINEIYRNEFLNNFVIGIQLRTEFLDVEMDKLKFLNCALQIENEYLTVNKNNSKPVKWYLSSDSEPLLKSIVALYPEKAIVGKGDILHVDHYINGYFRTLVDSGLLSKCDELIHTGGSTFGYVSAMRSFRVPYNLDGKSQQIKCVRTLFSANKPQFK